MNFIDSDDLFWRHLLINLNFMVRSTFAIILPGWLVTGFEAGCEVGCVSAISVPARGVSAGWVVVGWVVGSSFADWA